MNYCINGLKLSWKIRPDFGIFLEVDGDRLGSFCSPADFQELLENYCSAVFGDKVRIIRSNHKLGLIKARLLGARMTRGDVIIPMHSHMEVQETWYEYCFKIGY